MFCQSCHKAAPASVSCFLRRRGKVRCWRLGSLLSSNIGAYKVVKTRFWPQLPGQRPETLEMGPMRGPGPGWARLRGKVLQGWAQEVL